MAKGWFYLNKWDLNTLLKLSLKLIARGFI